MKRYLLAAALMLPAFAALAADPLARFFTDVRNYSARFEQVVVDESGQTLQQSSGRMWIQRPDKFRWDYAEPFEQHIVGDGKRVWVYDVGLEQVTVRPLARALGDTPAALLAGHGSIAENFTVNKLARAGGDWVELAPKKKDAGFEKIRLGFQKNVLRHIELLDAFGQMTRISLSDYRENTPIDAARFSFTPPPGADVLQQ